MPTKNDGRYDFPEGKLTKTICPSRSFVRIRKRKKKKGKGTRNKQTDLESTQFALQKEAKETKEANKEHNSLFGLEKQKNMKNHKLEIDTMRIRNRNKGER